MRNLGRQSSHWRPRTSSQSFRFSRCRPSFHSILLRVRSALTRTYLSCTQALDLSREALNVAEERAKRADLVGKPNNAVFHHMSLYDVADLDR